MPRLLDGRLPDLIAKTPATKWRLVQTRHQTMEASTQRARTEAGVFLSTVPTWAPFVRMGWSVTVSSSRMRLQQVHNIHRSPTLPGKVQVLGKVPRMALD